MPFTLYPKVPASDFVAEGNFSNASNWRARSCSRGKKREMEGVGYIMFHREKDFFIPIAHSDEHRMGYEILHAHWARKVRGLVPQEFVPFHAHGPNFVYEPSDIVEMQRLAKRWLAWGGAETLLFGTYGLKLTVLLSDFVEGNFTVGTQVDTDSAFSQRVSKAFMAVSEAIEAYRPSLRRSDAKAVFQSCSSLFDLLRRTGSHLNYMDANAALEAAQQALAESEAKDEPLGVESPIFGFGGLKNALHKSINNAMANPDGICAGDIQSLWGDLKIASAKLAAL